MSGVYELVLLVLFCELMTLVLAAGYQGHCPPSFPCGYLGSISFPFTTTERQDCGLLPIHNCDDPYPYKHKMVQLEKNGKLFWVLRVSPSPQSTTSTFQFRDKDLYDFLQNRSCEAFTNNYTLPHTFNFAALRITFNTTLIRCNRTLHVRPPTHMCNYTKCRDYDLYYEHIIPREDASSLRACTKVQLPIKDEPDGTDPFTFVNADINTEVKLTDECADCHYRQRGQCQLDNTHKFCCVNALKNGLSWTLKLGLALVFVAAGVVVLLIVLACCFRKKIFSSTSLLFWRENPTHRIIEGFLKEHGPLPTARYSYSEVKKMTVSFRNKLGQGGFGSVYKGKLCDGRVVAVKILHKSDGNGEEFINEVASISRTSHVNIVRLLGFCLDKSKRALVYEFMPNGSLDKFIYEDKNPPEVAPRLDCKILYDIAIGIARGLEYLHRGCNTRILHFDIKPHNILLDEDFCPKISDFGLAKICLRKESAVSVFGARGTAGYIAPEVFSRNFGSVSHKSDVYSYGMMILEMVGMRKNIKDEVAHSSEIYFPHWIYTRLESNQEFGLQNIEDESDDQMVRKMTIVGLWCIQTHPSARPAISKVVEMLESKVELLQIPPKPFLSSPSTSPAHLSCEGETL